MREEYGNYRPFILNSKSYLLVLLSIVSLRLIACSTATSPEVIIKNERSYSIDAKTKILVLPPKITYERKDTGQQISEANIKTEDLQKWICKIAKSEIQHRGLSVLEKIENANNESTKSGIRNLKEFSDNLVRNSPKISYLNLTESICRQSKISAVLFQHVRVKVGSEDEWTIEAFPLGVYLVPKVKKSSSCLRSVIRECGTGRILWQNEAFLRELPSTQSETFENAIRSQYSNLTKGGQL